MFHQLRFFVMVMLMVILIQGCKKDDPAPILCYITSLTEFNSGYAFVTTYTYDATNRVSGVVIVGGGSTTEIEYIYDGTGKAVGATYSEGVLTATETYTYDGSNRHIGTAFTLGSSISTSAFVYNATDQLITATYAANDFIETDNFSYPNQTSLSFSGITYSYTTNGNTFTGSYAYEYDKKLNPQRLVPGNPVVAENNPTRRTASFETNLSVTTYAYQYNEKGYPVSAAVQVDGSPSSTVIAYSCK